MKFRQHGIVIALATVLHLAMVLYIMIPSFVEAIIPDYIVPTPLAITSVIGLIPRNHWNHSLIAWRLIVASWRFRKNLKECFNKKKFMCKTLNVWIASIVFEIILYSIFIGPLFAS